MIPKALLVLWIFLGALGAAKAATAEPLTSLQAIRASADAKAGNSLPVLFEATVTFYRPYERTLFVQDGNEGIFVLANVQPELQPGDRVRIQGMTQGSFRPVVVSSSIALLHHGQLPRPVPAVFDELIRGAMDSKLVSIRGQVRAAEIVYSSDHSAIKLQLATEGGRMEAIIDTGSLEPFKHMLDAEVEVTGVAGGLFDGKMDQIGIVLHVSAPSDVKMLRSSGRDPWSLPITPINRILDHYHITSRSRRVHIQGTITYQQLGAGVVIQNKDRGIWVKADNINGMRLGDIADVTGYPTVQDGFLALEQGDVLDRYWPVPITPLPVTWRQISNSEHIFELVSIEAKVLAEVREPTEDNYILSADGHLLSAVIRHRSFQGTAGLAALKRILPGSRVRVTGVCVPGDSNPYNPNVPFNILMSSASDITVLARPSWINQTNLLRLISAMLVVIVAVTAWGWTLRRRVRRQTEALARQAAAEAALQQRIAHLEQRRRRIVEEINGDVPLSEILEQIADITVLELNGAQCWFEAANGRRYGQLPPNPESLRVLDAEIPSPSGSPLGIIYAALPADAAQPASAADVLMESARVAALAIETRRLYADLRHRSEYDQLTDLHNRFYLERQLDRLIEEAEHTGATFGLIFIDLDRFKQINDRYGHHIGDLYLQEVARRMKKQIRGADLLARLGGDEFAALTPLIRDRAEAEDIVRRLQRCFEQPFHIENFLIHAGASFGLSLYPEDGTTKDALLREADAIMYAAKRAKPEALEVS